VLAAACWVQGRRHPLDGPKVRLTRRIVVLLVLQATVGVTGFNYCTAEAVRHTGAATVGTVIAAVPVVLAIAGPLAARRRPAPRVIAAALLVAAGAAVVTGLGGTNLPGLLLALGALVAEVSFTLVAVPLRALFAGLVPFGAMGAELLLGAGTIGPADVAGAVLVAAGVAAGAGAARTGQRKKKDTAAAPQQSRTRTGAPRA
jgi:drug/metabolite transporter (DMT)-like permease